MFESGLTDLNLLFPLPVFPLPPFYFSLPLFPKLSFIPALHFELLFCPPVQLSTPELILVLPPYCRLATWTREHSVKRYIGSYRGSKQTELKVARVNDFYSKAPSREK